jgi:septal ring-binding cell division protein DamX
MLLGAGSTYFLMRPSAAPTDTPLSPSAAPADTVSHNNQPAPQNHISERLAAGKQLLTSTQAGYTLLLSVTNPPPNPMLEDFLKNPPVDGSKLYLYETSAKGTRHLALIYNTYPDQASALQALKSLPQEILRNHPYLRSLNKIREEIKISL